MQHCSEGSQFDLDSQKKQLEKQQGSLHDPNTACDVQIEESSSVPPAANVPLIESNHTDPLGIISGICKLLRVDPEVVLSAVDAFLEKVGIRDHQTATEIQPWTPIIVEKSKTTTSPIRNHKTETEEAGNAETFVSLHLENQESTLKESKLGYDDESIILL